MVLIPVSVHTSRQTIICFIILLYYIFSETRNAHFYVYLKAVRYSTSPIGGSTPPVHAMFTLKPLPPPDPTCRDTGWQDHITLSHCVLLLLYMLCNEAQNGHLICKVTTYLGSEDLLNVSHNFKVCLKDGEFIIRAYKDYHVCVCVYLLRSSTAREKVSIIISMKGDVEDTGITVEGLLGAIAMMNILQWQVTEG